MQDQEQQPAGEQQRPEEKVKEVHHWHYKEKKVWFSPGKLFAGVLVVLIGLFLLLNNMGLVSINMKWSVWDLWPLLLILIGLSMISFRGFLGALVGVVIALLAAVIVFLILFGHLDISGSRWSDWKIQFEFSPSEIFHPQTPQPPQTP